MTMTNTPDPLRDLYRSLSGPGALPLEPDDNYYVPILASQPEKDPILLLSNRLLWAESESVSLLTGFRGNGKSTELRRLRSLLRNDGCRVFLVNMADFLLMSKPLELSDFLLSLMSALALAVENETTLPALGRGYWERLSRFLNSEVKLDRLDMNLAAPGAPLKLGARLQTDPDFKQMIQQHLRGHLTGLVRDAHIYVGELVDALRDDAGDPDLKVVLLVDSVEQLRGNGDDATKVQQSVVELFNGQAASLALPRLHVVYTIPPYLQALSKNLGRLLGGHPIVSWPNVHVRSRTGRNDGGEVKIMQEIVERRFPAWSEIIPERLLTRIAKSSGGDLHPPTLE